MSLLPTSIFSSLVEYQRSSLFHQRSINSLPSFIVMWCVGHSVMLSVYWMKLPITRRSISAVFATYSTLLQLKHFPSKIWDAVSSLSVLFLFSSASNRAIKFPNFLFPFYTNSDDVVKCFIFFGRTRIFDIIISSFI